MNDLVKRCSTKHPPKDLMHALRRPIELTVLGCQSYNFLINAAGNANNTTHSSKVSLKGWITPSLVASQQLNKTLPAFLKSLLSMKFAVADTAEDMG